MLKIIITGQFDERPPFDHDGPIEFGRGPQRGQVFRCVLTNPKAATDHLRVEETADGLLVTNLCAGQTIRLPDNKLLAPQGKTLLKPPVPPLRLSGTLITVEIVQVPQAIARLSVLERPPHSGQSAASRLTLSSLGPKPTPERLIRWFEGIIAEGRSSDDTAAFYRNVTQAIVDLVELDRAWVLFFRDGRWVVEASSPVSAAGRDRQVFSENILRQVADDGKTYYESDPGASSIQSIQGLEAVIASPIFDERNRVMGAIYGARGRSEHVCGPAITELEAQVVQFLAAYLGSRLAWIDLDRRANRLRLQFEQFFSPALARALERDESLLQGRQRDITVMFVDIRRFSRLAERLGPKVTSDFTVDIMEHITAKIRDTEGVVVDYTGDGLFAIWNAPEDQPTHRDLACRAALAILDEMPRISESWRDIVGEPLNVGIGLNSGPAFVGNTGSRYRFKYGAMGHTVNLGSRVEGITKHVGVPVLMTAATHKELKGSFSTRRIGLVRPVGLNEPVDVYELRSGANDQAWIAMRDCYEAALGSFEAGKFAQTCRLLQPVLANPGESAYDLPSLDLIARATQYLKAPPETHDPILTLTSK